MTGNAIFGPFIGMLVLTFAVWVVMYVRRIGFIKSHNIDAQQLTTPDRAVEIIPEAVAYPAYNLRNLFELPVIFYALCVFLFVTAQVDAVYVWSAWAFVASRVAHSVIHCSVNIVMLRFLAYLAGALALWFMVLRAAFQYLNA